MRFTLALFPVFIGGCLWAYKNELEMHEKLHHTEVKPLIAVQIQKRWDGCGPLDVKCRQKAWFESHPDRLDDKHPAVQAAARECGLLGESAHH